MPNYSNAILSDSEMEKVIHFFPQGLVSIDLETTGLSPLVDRIIEIAAIKAGPFGVEVLQTLINPEIDIPPHTIDIHNITDEMVKDAPLLSPGMKSLIDFIGELPVVAHNAKFDAGFLIMAAEKTKHTLAKNDIYCSCKLSRKTHPELVNHKLSTIVESLAIPLLNHHRATDDAIAGLKVFIHSLARLEKEEIKSSGFIFNFHDFGNEVQLDLPEHLKHLGKLVKEAAVVEIKYSGGNSHKNQFRPVKLTSLLNTPEGNILYARCLLSDMQKSFKLKKIVEVRKPGAEDIQKWLQK